MDSKPKRESAVAAIAAMKRPRTLDVASPHAADAPKASVGEPVAHAPKGRRNRPGPWTALHGILGAFRARLDALEHVQEASTAMQAASVTSPARAASAYIDEDHTLVVRLDDGTEVPITSVDDPELPPVPLELANANLAELDWAVSAARRSRH